MIRDRSLSVWIFDIQTRGDRYWKIHAKKYTGVYRHRAETETVRTAKSEQVVVTGHLRLLTRYVIVLRVHWHMYMTFRNRNVLFTMYTTTCEGCNSSYPDAWLNLKKEGKERV